MVYLCFERACRLGKSGFKGGGSRLFGSRVMSTASFDLPLIMRGILIFRVVGREGLSTRGLH